MKLLSYNLRNGGGRNYNPWRQMIREFSPDIVFAQESRHPQCYFEPEEFAEFKGCIHANVATHERWGSAILSRTHQLIKVSLSQPEYEGWVVGAMVPDMLIGGELQSVLIFSLHAPTLPGTYEGHVDKIISEIASKWPNTPMILAGDFNLTTAISSSQSQLGKNTEGEIRILGKLRNELGLVNAWQHLYPDDDLPQTLRWSSNKSIPFHCDAIFMNHNLLPRLANVIVKSDGNWGTMSDHNPIFALLE